ncbi:hypothetical protein [Siminovitchia terrae]|nr:hypothetical protein [Siminovitchia terrae]
MIMIKQETNRVAVVTGTGQGITVNSVGPAAIKTPKMNPLKLEK